MAVKAFVLIEARAGMTGEVVAAIRGLKGVASVDSVSGPYDAVAVLTADTLGEIDELIIGAIQQVAGIFRAITCIAT